jgi:hypothetical protein
MSKLALSLACVVLVVAGILAGTGAASAPAPSHPAQVAQLFEKAPECLKYAKKHGKKVCVKRAKARPKTAPGGSGDGSSPTPTPIPTPIAGSYVATTAQGGTLEFRIVGEAPLVTIDPVAFDEIDKTCTPGPFGWGFAWKPGGSGSVGDDGRFSLTLPYTYQSGGSGSVVFAGIVDTTGRASGTLTLSESYSGATTGTHYSCTASTTWSGGTGAAAPAPTAHAPLGHYAGTTSQGAAVQFDVVSGGSGRVMTNMSIVEIDESCDPGQLRLKMTGYAFDSLFVDGLGHEHDGLTWRSSTEVFTLDSSIDASGHATGTFSDTRPFLYNGTTYACASGTQTWSAARV